LQTLELFQLELSKLESYCDSSAASGRIKWNSEVRGQSNAQCKESPTSEQIQLGESNLFT